jgi:serine-type D-Ala-D-Ala carboxypeptidase/endopeptidase (penicillin-binding protein 4)
MVALVVAGLSGGPRRAAAAPTSDADRAGPLETTLDEILAGGALAGARVGACVVSLDSGATLYQHHADVLLNPASNVKLFTSAAALVRLGPDYRFETEVSVDAASAGTGSARSLFVRGKGDPSLTTERLWMLAGDIAHAGLRRVTDLVLDESWFDGERIGPGFDQEEGDKAYLAPVGALSLNFNVVAVHVAPGDRPGAPARVEVEPDSGFFEVVNELGTVGPKAARRLVVASIPSGGRQRILVQGRLPAGGRPSVVWRKIDDPPRYLGETLRRLLELRGVKVTGRVRLGTVPAEARLLVVSESEALGDLVRRLNKSSNNFMAEQLLKALGAATAGPPGHWSTGVAAVEAVLGEFGLPRGSFVMKNGSGLNDANRFSARQVVRLLAEMWRRFPVAAEFLSSLPVAGKDGTLRGRGEGTDAVGRVRAKTGTLDGVTALSGYAEGGRERLAFAVMVNDASGKVGAAALAEDAVAAALAGWPRGPRAGPPASPAPAAATARLAVDQTIATYLAMGRSGDRRNLRFLLTAVPAEGEPSVRLAAAEALYRSDPDSEVARRAFLAAVGPTPEPEALAAVLAAAGPSEPTPVLSALADLAANGNEEALGRLIDLVPRSDPSPALKAALAAVLVDLADVIEGLLRTAVVTAPPATRAAAASLLGDRLPGLAGAAAEAPAMGPAPP